MFPVPVPQDADRPVASLGVVELPGDVIRMTLVPIYNHLKFAAPFLLFATAAFAATWKLHAVLGTAVVAAGQSPVPGVPVALTDAIETIRILWFVSAIPLLAYFLSFRVPIFRSVGFMVSYGCILVALIVGIGEALAFEVARMHSIMSFSY